MVFLLLEEGFLMKIGALRDTNARPDARKEVAGIPAGLILWGLRGFWSSYARVRACFFQNPRPKPPNLRK